MVLYIFKGDDHSQSIKNAIVLAKELEICFKFSLEHLDDPGNTVMLAMELGVGGILGGCGAGTSPAGTEPPQTHRGGDKAWY